MSAVIERAQPEDIPSVLSLLERHGLPLDGADAMDDAVVVARLDGRVVGAAGLERYADGALLRSVVVDAGAQGQGLGQRLTEAALALARDLRMPRVFLRTTTADGVLPPVWIRTDRAPVNSLTNLSTTPISLSDST